MSEEQKFWIIFNVLQVVLLLASSAVVMLVTVLAVGWLIALCVWLAFGYVGGCLTCGLVLRCPEGAKVLVLESPSICDAPPTWIVMLLGTIMVFRWMLVVVVTESKTHERAEYFEWYSPKRMHPHLQIARAAWAT